MVRDRNVAYIGCVYPHHARADLEEIMDAGCTSINLTVNEVDWFYYRKARRYIREVAGELGLKVYINMHGFGTFATTLPCGVYQMKHPESVQVFNDGTRPEHGETCCPTDKEYRKWLYDVVSDIIEYLKPDGMFWDEPRFVGSKDFPNQWACYCPRCRDLFEKRYGRPMPRQLDKEVIEFRQGILLEFLEELLGHAKKLGGGENVLCLMSWDRDVSNTPSSPGWYGVIDWEPFARLRDLDVFSTDPYWIHSKDFTYFEKNAEDAIRLAHTYGKLCQIWVQAVWVPPNREGDIMRSIRRAAEMGADMLAVWAYRGEPGAHVLDGGADHDKVWEVVKASYRENARNEG